VPIDVYWYKCGYTIDTVWTPKTTSREKNIDTLVKMPIIGYNLVYRKVVYMRKNPYILRCYARPEGDYILGVCVDLDIAVKGNSIDEVRNEMTNGIKAYFESLDEKNFKDVFPRRVPFLVMCDYYFICLLINIFKAKKNIQIFCEQLIPKNFTISPICG
jgi:hypothetical protein